MLTFLGAFYLIRKPVDNDMSRERDGSTANSTFLVDASTHEMKIFNLILSRSNL